MRPKTIKAIQRKSEIISNHYKKSNVFRTNTVVKSETVEEGEIAVETSFIKNKVPAIHMKSVIRN